MKNFKTLEWIRKIRDENSKLTRNMTKEELINHYRKNSQKLHKTLKVEVGNIT